MDPLTEQLEALEAEQLEIKNKMHEATALFWKAYDATIAASRILDSDEPLKKARQEFAAALNAKCELLDRKKALEKEIKRVRRKRDKQDKQ